MVAGAVFALEKSGTGPECHSHDGPNGRGKRNAVCQPRRRILEPEATGDGRRVGEPRGGHGISDGGGAGDGIGSGADLEDVAGGGVEVRLGDGDLVVLEVVDNVGAAEEGVAQDHAAGAGGRDAEQARLGAVREARALARGRDQVQHELVHLDRDDGRAEGEVERGVVVGLAARDVRRALVAVVLRRHAVVDGLHHGVGQVCQAAAAVQEHRQCLVLRDRLAAERHAGQCDQELGVHAALGLDRQRLELALELVRVHTAKQDLAGARVEVVQPQAVGIGRDLALGLHLRRQVVVGRQLRPANLHLVHRVAHSQNALGAAARVANTELEVAYCRPAY